MLSGKVVRGKGLGKDLGFPTANLKIEEAYKLIPQNGAYIITCKFGNKITQGMMNIGYNPTVDGKNKNIEVHLFNVDQDLYNKDLQIRLIKKIRDEQKFDSLQSLSNQLRTDKENALEFLKNEIY